MQYLSARSLVAGACRLEFVEYQLHPDAYEFHQFRQRRLIGLDAVVHIDVGACDLSQIAHDFSEGPGQPPRIGRAIAAETVEKSGAPGSQRLGAFLDRTV